MNRILVVFLALGVLGSNAFASRASNIVMGTGDAGVILNGGSFYYDDNYNIFYNPAYINDFKNYAIIEKSNYPGNTAQGGFVTTTGNVVLGFYFNRGNAIVSTSSAAALSSGAQSTYPGFTPALGGNYGAYNNGTSGAYPNRPIEVYAGTDLGSVKVGAGLTYAQNTQNSVQSTVLVGHLGAEYMGLDPFVNGNIVATDNGLNQSHNYINAGLRYHFGEFVPYFAILYTSDPGLALVNTSLAYKELNLGGGIGRTTHVAEGVRMNYGISYFSVNDTTGAGATPNRVILPIDISVEADALSWLTVRAGLGYRLLDKTNSISATDDTDGRVGATVHVGKADIEWAIGRSFNPASNQESNGAPYLASGTTTTTGPTNFPYDSQGVDIGAQFFSALNVAYHW